STGYKFMLPFREKTSLWKAEFRDADGREHRVDNRVKCRCQYKIEERLQDTLNLCFEWKDIDLGEEKNVVDIQVNLRLRMNSSLSFWRINVRNRSKKSCLWQVIFPLIENIGTTTSDPSEDYLLVPDGWGRIYRDPRSMSPYVATYPGGWNMAMQFLSFGHINNGLYLAAHDPEAYHKRFIFNPDTYTRTRVDHPPKSSFKLINYPENMGVLQQEYEMPYDAVIGVYVGDWYDASQIYRDWVLENAVWCKKGALDEKADEADWFRRIVFWRIPVISIEDGVPFIVEDDIEATVSRTIHFAR
ncbi:unnamed protein product, partial [marine sediment metagenome]